MTFEDDLENPGSLDSGYDFTTNGGGTWIGVIFIYNFYLKLEIFFRVFNFIENFIVYIEISLILLKFH